MSTRSSVLDDMWNYFFSSESHTTLPSTSARSVQIINTSQHKVYFYYRSKGEQWKIFEIKSKDEWSLPCVEPEIQLHTKDKQVHYTLKCENRYVLYWNTNRELWDVGHVRD